MREQLLEGPSSLVLPKKPVKLFNPQTIPPEVKSIGEVIIAEQGSYQFVRRYYPGWYPQAGVLHFGLSGKETIVEQEVIRPLVKSEKAGN